MREQTPSSKVALQVLVALVAAGCEVNNPRYVPFPDLSSMPDLLAPPSDLSADATFHGALVSTFAGNGMAGFADGSGGKDGTAQFNAPRGLGIDGSGNLFVAEFNGHRVRKIDPKGNVTTVAGNGMAGFADGSGGKDGTAQFNQPADVVLDGSGNLFVADFSNHRIRKIDSKGAVTTVAGNGMAGFADGSGGKDGTAQFNQPAGVVLDGSGNLFVADFGNHRIRRIDPTGTVGTFAGNGMAGFADGSGGKDGTARFNQPAGVVLDGSGNLFVAEYKGHRVRKIDPEGNVTTFAGNGMAGFADGSGGKDGAAEFNQPAGVVLDGSGNLFVADLGNHRIRKIVIIP